MKGQRMIFSVLFNGIYNKRRKNERNESGYC